MAVHKIVINGIEYANVGSIKPQIEEKLRLDVETLDGVRHKIVEWTKTNQEVVFFNLLDGVYTSLREFIRSAKSEPVRCGIPNDNGTYDYRDYFLTITGENNKGFLRDGVYYKNGLAVKLEAVTPDV